MRRSHCRLLVPGAALSIALQLAGCGGGGGGSDGSSGAGQTVQLGPFTTRVAGTAQAPVTASSASSVGTGVAGASISSLVFQDSSPTLAETRLAFVRQDTGAGHLQIYVMGADGSGPHRISDGTATDSFPSWSPDGARMAFARFNGSITQIYVMGADGSSSHRISDGTTSDYTPSWSPDGATIAFARYDYSIQRNRIWVMAADGSNPHPISDGTIDDTYPSWSPDGKKFAFQGFDPAVGHNRIYVMSADGSGSHQVSAGTGDDYGPASWSPDGARIAYMHYEVSLGRFQIYVSGADGSSPHRISDGSSNDTYPFWSPDGTKVAFRLSDAATGHSQIYVMATDGSSRQRVSDGTAEEVLAAWSPFVKTRNLIGPGGSMGAAAAGFLYGESGDVLTGVLTFDTASPTTRADARIAAQSGQSFSPSELLFSITTSDSLSSLAYTNDLYSTPTAVIAGGSPSAVGALASINSATGRIASVLPYVASRAAGIATTREGTALVCRGRFVGVWDDRSRNEAPYGASEVRIDAATGKLLGFK